MFPRPKQRIGQRRRQSTARAATAGCAIVAHQASGHRAALPAGSGRRTASAAPGSARAGLARRQVDPSKDRRCGVPLKVRLLVTPARPFAPGGRGRRERQAPASVEASESLGKARIDLHPRLVEDEIARRAGEAGRTDRSSTCGRRAVTPTVTKALNRSSVQAPGRSLGAEAASFPRKPPDKLPRPSSAKPKGPYGVASAIVASFRSTARSGSVNGLPAWRRKQLVDLAPADAVADHPALQPNAARRDAIDLDLAVPLDPHLHHGLARGQVGVGGIADDKVAELLRAKANPIER